MRPLRLNEEVSHAGNERMGGVLGLKDLLRCERSLSKGQRARICKDKGEWGRLGQNLDKKGKRKREETPPPPVSVSRRRVSDVEIDYESEIRPQPGGPHYQELAVVSATLFLCCLYV